MFEGRSDLLTMRVKSGSDEGKEGMRRRGCMWEKRHIDFGLKASWCQASLGGVMWSEITDSKAKVCAYLTPPIGDIFKLQLFSEHGC